MGQRQRWKGPAKVTGQEGPVVLLWQGSMNNESEGDSGNESSSPGLN